MTPELQADIAAFARVCIASRGVRTRGTRGSQTSVTSTDGIGRLDIQIRLRRFHSLDWSFERVTAVVDALVARGGLVASRRQGGGYQPLDWEVIAALAAEEVAA